MSSLVWIPWVTGNRNHWWTRGPVHAGWGQIIAGVQAREQGNFAIVDLAFCAKGSGEPRCAGTRGEDWSSWATRNESYHWERSPFRVPEGHALVGFDVREQGGFGVVDIRCLCRRWGGQALDDALVEGPWLCGNSNGEAIRCVVPDGHVVAGADVREQGGFGVVDLRVAAIAVDAAAAAIAAVVDRAVASGMDFANV